ncbi:MAG: hypothetical protein AAGE52_15480 [Myxococcota bacterium]
MRTTLYLGVDMARFFLFHPDDFTAYEAAEIDLPERATHEALIVGLDLGADGHRGVEITDEPLSEKDRAEVSPGPPFVFPLRVTHGRLFATDRIARSDEYEWNQEPHVALPEGLYRAEWYRFEESRVRNANWLLLVKPVESFDELPAWDQLPHEDGYDLPDGTKNPRREPAATKVERVSHPKFGVGEVLSRNGDAVEVKFEDSVRRIASRFLKPA